MKEGIVIQTLLLWDIDGTLIRARGAGKRAMDRAFLELFGQENAFDGIGMAGGLDLHFIDSVFRKFQVDPERLPAYLEAYYEALAGELGEAEQVPGVVEILEELEPEDHVFHALGTGNLERGARIKLDVFDLNRFFPVGGFCEALVERYEVLQAGVDKAAAHYGTTFAPQQVIVIGDTTKDIGAARKMGARVVAVATGGHSYEQLEAAQPDLLLRDWQDPSPFYKMLRP